MKAEIDNATASQGQQQPESSGTPGVWLCTERDGIAIVRFDRPGSSVNVLDTETLRALAEIVGELHQRSLRGVILTSAKPAVFIAGADLKELVATRDRAALVDLGQQTFERFAALRCVTVSAIHGACAGGGFEMALACDYRVASDARTTRIGLPEVNLGLIPAWGGSTRLPRLVGLPRALQVILRASLMPATKALKLGLIDAICPRERLRYWRSGLSRKANPSATADTCGGLPSGGRWPR